MPNAQSHGWYSLIVASPQPESGETANVGVVFGNGQVGHVAFRDRLPRLSGIASKHEVAVFRAVLQDLAQAAVKGIDLEVLRTGIGPQLRVSAPRQLMRPATDELIEIICKRFLDPPKDSTANDEERKLANRSSAKLEIALRVAIPARLHIQDDVRPRSLYDRAIERYVPYRVPRLAKAVRAFERDLLVDSIIVEPEGVNSALRQALTRINRAFFLYKELAPRILQHTGTSIRLLGVLHPGTAHDTRDVAAARNYIKAEWSHYADVIDGNSSDVAEEIRLRSQWLLARPNGRQDAP